MADMRNETEVMFLSWLSSNVFPTQISELCLAYNEIEVYAKKVKIVKVSLYENLDILLVKKLRADIERSIIFKFTHKRQWRNILLALDYLQKFIIQEGAQNKTELNIVSIPKQNAPVEDTVCVVPEENSVFSQEEFEEGLSHEADKASLQGHVEATLKDNTVNFDALESMAFTKPITLSYFGDTKSEFTWKSLYVDACAMLFDDYPDVFLMLKEESIFGEEKTWLVDSAHVNLLAVPEKVTDDLFVETNRSASDLLKNLKWLLDKCAVDYENMVITYCKKAESSETVEEIDQPTRMERTTTQEYFCTHKEAFYRWMLEEQHKAENTCRGYVSAILTAERFAEENDIACGRLFTDNFEEAKITAKALFENPGFVRLNADRHNQFSAAISMLFAFYSVDQKALSIDVSVDAENDSVSRKTQNATVTTNGNEMDIFLDGDEFLPLREALISHNITTVDGLRELKLWPFMNRYNIYSIGVRQTIYAKVNDLLHPIAILNDEQAYILHVGEKQYKGSSPAEAFRLFCDSMLGNYPLQLRLLIGMKMPTGAIPIYKDGNKVLSLKLTSLAAFIRADLSVEEVVSYTNWVQNRCDKGFTTVTMTEPKNKEMPVDITVVTDTGSKMTETAVLSSESEEALRISSMKTVSEYVPKLAELTLAADLQGLSYDEAKNALHTTMTAIRRAAMDSESIVEINGRLIHEDAFVDWEEGANQIERIIDKLMQRNRGYISAAQLYEYAKVEMNMFLTDNDVNEERSIFDIATHLFEKRGYHGKRYVFYGKAHISREDHPITSNLDIFRNFALDQGGIFSFGSLVEYLHYIGVASSNLRAQMRIPDKPIFFYYESDILMYAESMHIDKDWIATIRRELETLLVDVGGHIVLRKLPEIWLERLPVLPARKQWTPLLLQSVLRCYSKELGAQTIQALSGQSLNTLHAMLVANDSQIQTFGDVVVSYLVDNDISSRSFKAENLRLQLVDAGILQGNELIWNMSKALGNDERFAWNASGDHVIVEV